MPPDSSDSIKETIIYVLAPNIQIPPAIIQQYRFLLPYLKKWGSKGVKYCKTATQLEIALDEYDEKAAAAAPESVTDD